MIVAAIAPGIDPAAFGAGFALAGFSTLVAWWGLLGLALLRRLLTDAVD